MADGELLRAYRKKATRFNKEIQTLRFGLKPPAVYFNPTERCNLNCTYCYIPEKTRSNGRHMSSTRLRSPPTAHARNWSGQGVYQQVLDAMDRLRGYDAWSVICTVTSENLRHLTRLVEFFHAREVPTCLMNILRCTMPGARTIKPTDASAARHFLAALDRTYELYQETGRELPVADFANVLLAIVAPTARRLMCDISPCGGGRCFFALAPNGDMFPCSEFIGLKRFMPNHG